MFGGFGERQDDGHGQALARRENDANLRSEPAGSPVLSACLAGDQEQQDLFC
jgi:hypothetical protein